MGPAARTLTLYGLAVLSGLAMVVIAFVSLRGAETATGELIDQAVPAQLALREVADRAAESQRFFLAAVESPDPAESGLAIAGAQTAGRQGDDAWNEYRALALGGQEERALQQAYDTGSETANQLGAQIIAMDPNDPGRAAALADERRASEDLENILAAIEARVYQPILRENLDAVRSGIDRERQAVAVAYGGLVVLMTAVGFVLLRSALRDQRHMAEETAAARESGEVAAFEGAFQRGLELASSEEATFDIFEQALSMVAPEVPTELLLADSSRAHFRQVLTTDDDEQAAACRVGAPDDCPAARSGQTRWFEDSRNLDACRFLRGREEPVWAVCVPVSIAGRRTGVVHAQGGVDQEPPERIVSGLELVTRKAGERIGAIRILARTEVQAQVDPLTGLPNRRTLEQQASELSDAPYVVAFADLDHFKAINDGHGHETGDRALRLFARVLRDSVRPRDLIARFGGEEFVVVFPDCTVDDARVVAERVRAQLARALDNGDVPEFTVTFGLSESLAGDDLATVIARADVTMLGAKKLGRDRVVATGDAGPDLAAVPTAG